MSGAEAPQDVRCPCGRKIGEATSKGVELLCRGCGKPVLLPFGLRSVIELFQYFAGLKPRRKKGWRRRQKEASE